MNSAPVPTGSLLLVDDDPGILRLQRKRLEAAGYSVVSVQTTAEAREQVRKGRFALLVLDYRLGGGESGLEFYQQLRAEGCDVPAVLVTAFSDESKLFEALRAGVRDVIPKSGEYLDYLPQAVSRVMRQIAAERQAVETEALRRSEERLRALNADLERSRERLQAQAEQLADANRSKDIFLATLAHELRNPLAPIRFALALLKDPQQQARAREVIERQLSHLVRLVDDLLDVSRITRDKIQLRVERAELGAIMRAAVEAVTPELQSAQHKFTFVPPQQAVWLDADAARLTQVFTNLLNNAVKYTPHGGALSYAAHLEGDRVTVTVKDSGIGIAREDLRRVFDMFYQAGNGSDQSIGGLGIGLMLVRRLVEMHGGTVIARSEGPGTGSEFVVSLPVVHEVAETRDDSRRTEPEANGLPLHILVVDDNVDSADMLAVLVGQMGHQTQVAHASSEAIEKFRKFHPQVVLLDIGLPGVSGYDLARQFRKETDGNLFLVAITGWGQDEDKRRAEQAGFDCHLTKPADPDAIALILSAAASRGANPPANRR